MEKPMKAYLRAAGGVLLVLSLVGLQGCVVLKRIFQGVRMVMQPAVPTSECTLETVDAGGIFGTLFPGRIDSIPEFHDCQRFLAMGADGKLHYTSAFAIFATEGLGGVWDRVKAKLPGQLSYEIGAVIYAWNDDYAPLGIKRGFNCVYVENAGVMGTPLPGAIVTPYVAPACVPVPANLTDAGLAVAQLKFLKGRIATVAGFPNAADYPVVARWQWDAPSNQYYIGINCGSAGWCELFDKTKPDPVATTPVQGAGRVASIQGWYDQQILSGRPEGDVPSVTGTVGTLVPHPDLGAYTMTKFQNEKWVPVAYVAMSQNDPIYFATYGFIRAPFDPNHLSSMNRVHLCYGSKERCGIPTALACTYPGVSPDQQWWVRITSAPPSILSLVFSAPGWPYVPHRKFLCAERRAHPGKTIPGTVRWRWTKYDETIWVRCADGCCEVDS